MFSLKKDIKGVKNEEREKSMAALEENQTKNNQLRAGVNGGNRLAAAASAQRSLRHRSNALHRAAHSSPRAFFRAVARTARYAAKRRGAKYQRKPRASCRHQHGAACRSRSAAMAALMAAAGSWRESDVEISKTEASGEEEMAKINNGSENNRKAWRRNKSMAK